MYANGGLAATTDTVSAMASIDDVLTANPMASIIANKKLDFGPGLQSCWGVRVRIFQAGQAILEQPWGTTLPTVTIAEFAFNHPRWPEVVAI